MVRCGFGTNVEGVINLVATARPADSARISIFRLHGGDNAEVLRDLATAGDGGDRNEEHCVGALDNPVTLGEPTDFVSIRCLPERAFATLATKLLVLGKIAGIGIKRSSVKRIVVGHAVSASAVGIGQDVGQHTSGDMVEGLPGPRAVVVWERGAGRNVGITPGFEGMYGLGGLEQRWWVRWRRARRVPSAPVLFSNVHQHCRREAGQRKEHWERVREWQEQGCWGLRCVDGRLAGRCRGGEQWGWGDEGCENHCQGG